MGIGTCSAGNHGLGVAFTANHLNLYSAIYVPSNVNQTKYEGTLDLRAKVIKSKRPGHDDAAELTHAHSDGTGKTHISSFDDYRIMAINGSIYQQTRRSRTLGDLSHIL